MFLLLPGPGRHEVGAVRHAVAPDKVLRQNGIQRILGKHATKATCLLEDAMVKLP